MSLYWATTCVYAYRAGKKCWWRPLWFRPDLSHCNLAREVATVVARCSTLFCVVNIRLLYTVVSSVLYYVFIALRSSRSGQCYIFIRTSRYYMCKGPWLYILDLCMYI